MTISADLLRTHLDYTQWASSRLIEVAGSLTPEELTHDFGTADKSVLGTLVHMFAGERAWLDHLENAPAREFVTEAEYQLSVVQNDWPVLHQHWRDWAAGLTDAAAQAPVSYSDFQGNRRELRVWQIVLHVVNHGTHHRGQVSGFLRALGRTPPKTDMTRYYESTAAR